MIPTSVFLCFPYGSASKESACNAGDLGLISGWEDPLEKAKATHSSILAGEFHGLYSPWGHKELDTTEQVSLHFFIYIYIYIVQNRFCTNHKVKGEKQALEFPFISQISFISHYLSQYYSHFLPQRRQHFTQNCLHYTKCNRNANSHEGKYCFLFSESLGSLPKKQVSW